MQQAFDPLVVAQIVLAAGADIAFAFAMGAVLIGAGSGGSERLRIVRMALAAWIVVETLYLPLQASAMSGSTLADALPAIPLVIAHSHFGLMWLIGMAAGITALLATIAPRPAHRHAVWTDVLQAALVVVAFAHAASTHAADAGDFSAAELVHMVHLLATAGWAGVVITAAWPLRRILTAEPDAAANMTRLSNVATCTFLIAIATGLMNAYRGLGGTLAPLTSSLWGQLLEAKVIIVTVAIAIGAINRFVHLRHMRAGNPAALPAFMRLLTMEAVLLVLALAVAATLGHSIPAATG
ncbi:CopD family protein [Paraburkholderia sartisoli]|uniref:Putative copper resistance protein D n=1 Tax=Paraburkholderia sartisoli TaxID=83784 RepID=A0A1H3Z1B8_9BURK|nr:CopD family protein [Paraburkholderia sartisoli]SEA17535.1 putative copper resistance protein D [Paraburkholderia sartisoli]